MHGSRDGHHGMDRSKELLSEKKVLRKRTGSGVWSYDLVTRMMPTDINLLQYSITVCEIIPYSTILTRWNLTGHMCYTIIIFHNTTKKMCGCIASHRITIGTSTPPSLHHDEHSSQIQYNLNYLTLIIINNSGLYKLKLSK